MCTEISIGRASCHVISELRLTYMPSEFIAIAWSVKHCPSWPVGQRGASNENHKICFRAEIRKISTMFG